MKAEWLLCRFGDLEAASPGMSGGGEVNEAGGAGDPSDHLGWKLLWVVANPHRVQFFNAETQLPPEEIQEFSSSLLEPLPKKPVPLKDTLRMKSLAILPEVDDVSDDSLVESFPSKSILIDVAEDQANHLHAFEIISGSKVAYCATTTSRRMFEWIFVLQHLKNGLSVNVNLRHSAENEVVTPTEEQKKDRKPTMKALHTQFSSLFSTSLLQSLGSADESREKWRASIQNIIMIKDVTSGYESLLGDSYTKLITKFGYVMEKEIGQGAFGKVYRVKNQSTGKHFAMKSFEKDSIPMVLEQFRVEKQVLQSLPIEFRLVTLHETLEDDDFFYLVLEYCAGGDLYTMIEQNEIPEETVKMLAAEAVLAIHSMHRNGYCHRDIKPDNFILDESGHLKLCDFGFCALLGDDGKVENNMSVGTPEYIAPEVLIAAERGLKYGRECDWWSLGIVVFEMLFGYTPFNTPNVLKTYSAIKEFKIYFRFPEVLNVSAEAQEFIKMLLCDVESRMNFEAIKAHPFLADINWESLEREGPPKDLRLTPRVGGKPVAPPLPEPSVPKTPPRPKFPPAVLPPHLRKPPPMPPAPSN